MAVKKSGGLGRGLGSILPDIDDMEVGKPAADSISMVPVAKIEANPFQPRKEFDDEALAELAQSIRKQGVITPVTVRHMPDGTYQLIAGERRFRASQMAGLKELPAYVRTATDTQMMEMALVENIQRADLNAIEVAQAYRQLIEECSLTHEELSDKVGKNRSTITNYLRLLSLPNETQQALASGQISMAHARVLAGLRYFMPSLTAASRCIRPSRWPRARSHSPRCRCNVAEACRRATPPHRNASRRNCSRQWKSSVRSAAKAR